VKSKVEDGRPKVAFLETKVTLRANLHKYFPKRFMVIQIHVLYANFVKFG